MDQWENSPGAVAGGSHPVPLSLPTMKKPLKRPEMWTQPWPEVVIGLCRQSAVGIFPPHAMQKKHALKPKTFDPVVRSGPYTFLNLRFWILVVEPEK